jgi:type III pantothenate kinase
MLLLDIGNTNVKCFDGTKVWREKVETFVFPRERFYYINVNPRMQKRLDALPHAIDLKNRFDFKSDYHGLGVDRIAACYTVQNGIVVDAGSAITVDRMCEGIHEGGFIMPGLSSAKESFANISAKLAFDPENEVDMAHLPQNTADALSYATIKPVILMIDAIRKDLPVIVTGGDGKRLIRYLDNAEYRENLVFEGMEKVIQEKAIKEKQNAC